MNRVNQGGEAAKRISQVEGKQEQRPRGKTVAQVGSEQQFSPRGRCKWHWRGRQGPRWPPKYGLWPGATG